MSSFQRGAFEYLPKPFDIDDVVDIVKRAIQYARESRPVEAASTDGSAPGMVGTAPAMQDVYRAIGRLSRANITVLVTGESGTGKELIARALHQHSPRAQYPFIALNTAAIPRDLLESELFGHERGAFTGAQQQRTGRFEQANGGTLFLDEIGDMPAELQTRLLRVLATGDFYRVGGQVPVKVDVRIIAATHQDLEARVSEGRFREDLYHRLNVVRVHAPALRDRREDIPALLEHFLQVSARELNTDRKSFSPEVASYLTQLVWPGNVRQLENMCRWLTVMSAGHEIRSEDLPGELRDRAVTGGSDQGWDEELRRWAERRLAQGDDHLLQTALPRFEQVMIEASLKFAKGRRQDAARLLGWGRNTLTRKIKEHGF